MLGLYFKKATAPCVANKAAKEKAADETPASKSYAEALESTMKADSEDWPDARERQVDSRPLCVRCDGLDGSRARGGIQHGFRRQSRIT